ncbi:hypothetical protein COR50_05875 [Chitinophaga caeni]|uniref:Nucleoid-associated protein n=1 Tax=Chitinophaga caeni TaxID=2029983 RepID=A0A291QRW6_9BACT|nr:nucleoid-associated protein [Chitinophaga caeni]ATL46738.1 hypothetical protein COR50_05875 [Chitinophaga caeni]
MIHVADTNNLSQLAIHKVGNAGQEEPLILSPSNLNLDDETVANLLLNYFIQPFVKNAEYFHFTHDADIELNEIYKYCSLIFDDKDQFHEQSIHIAKHLYKSSTHPKIKGGELYIVYFDNCQVDGEEMEAVGIFKSETKDTYLKVFLQQDNYGVNYDDGININKLDKGCLVFNTKRDEGYKVSIVDSISKQNEAIYWKDAFLQVQRLEDSYHQTETAVTMCKEFIQNHLPNQYEMNKADQIDLLNKSAAYFKENEQFEMDEFAQNVFGHEDAVASFRSYKEQFQKDFRLDVPDEFDISAPAVKRNQKDFKSVLKLDKNFHVYIHGDRDKIERGYDELTNMQYYKLYFESES